MNSLGRGTRVGVLVQGIVAGAGSGIQIDVASSHAIFDHGLIVAVRVLRLRTASVVFYRPRHLNFYLVLVSAIGSVSMRIPRQLASLRGADFVRADSRDASKAVYVGMFVVTGIGRFFPVRDSVREDEPLRIARWVLYVREGFPAFVKFAASILYL